MTNFVSSLAENRVRSFVHAWYAAWDQNLPSPDAIIAMIAPSASVAFGPTALKTESALRAAYAEMVGSLRLVSHHVLGVQVELVVGGAQVRCDVLHQRVWFDGREACMRVVTRMALVESSDGTLRVANYETHRVPD